MNETETLTEVTKSSALLDLALVLGGFALFSLLVVGVAYVVMRLLFLAIPAPAVVRFLSWRYLIHRPTNLIGVVGIFLGVGALIMILSIMTGFLEQTRTSMRGSLSDMILLLPGTEAPRRPYDAQKILEVVRADPRVEAASPHLSWPCFLTREGGNSLLMLSDPQRSRHAFVQLAGIDVEDEKIATEFHASLVRPPDYGESVADPTQPFAPPPEYDSSMGIPRASVILGEQLFAAHRLRRGDFVTLIIPVRDPQSEYGFAAKEREFVVAGSFRSSENEMDLERIYVERGQLARFMAGANEEDELPRSAMNVSQVLIKLRNYETDRDAAQRDLYDALKEKRLIDSSCQLATWEEFRGSLLGAIENERVLLGIMLSLVLLVACFTVFAILSMMVSEKRRDIGILTALGATPRLSLMVFLAIGFWDALIGAFLGACTGVVLALKIDGIERWLSAALDVQIFNRNVYLFDTIPSVVEPLAVGAIVLGAFLCTLLFAAIPAWRAARLDPVEALRNE
jgi:lipoprotein-releasing system permease protein